MRLRAVVASLSLLFPLAACSFEVGQQLGGDLPCPGALQAPKDGHTRHFEGFKLVEVSSARKANAESTECDVVAKFEVKNPDGKVKEFPVHGTYTAGEEDGLYFSRDSLKSLATWEAAYRDAKPGTQEQLDAARKAALNLQSAAMRETVPADSSELDWDQLLKDHVEDPGGYQLHSYGATWSPESGKVATAEVCLVSDVGPWVEVGTDGEVVRDGLKGPACTE